MPPRRRSHLSITAVVLASAFVTLPLTLTGCLAGRHTSTSIHGAYVQPSDLSRVKKHRSTTDDVLQMLGEPTERITNDDGTETWTWNWTRKEEGSGHLFLIFNGSSKTEVDESVHVTFEYGVVKDKWRD